MNKWILEAIVSMHDATSLTEAWFIAMAINFIRQHSRFGLTIRAFPNEKYYLVYYDCDDFTLAGKSERLEVALALVIRDLCRKLEERKEDDADQSNEQGNDDAVDETRAGQTQASA